MAKKNAAERALDDVIATYFRPKPKKAKKRKDAANRKEAYAQGGAVH